MYEIFDNKVPRLYSIVHVVLGLISGFLSYSTIGFIIFYIFICYQFIQLILNKRIFLFEAIRVKSTCYTLHIDVFDVDAMVKEGNSFEYTLKKVLQFVLGYIVGNAIFNIVRLSRLGDMRYNGVELLPNLYQHPAQVIKYNEYGEKLEEET